MVSRLQLGGPLLVDPESTIMSPLTSRSSTPPTPLTGLTIPSPGPHDTHKRDKTALSKSVGVEKSEVLIKKKEEDLASRNDITQPASIPLPPSPKLTKESLPCRRPRISNPLNRVVSETSAPRSSSERRVSSALQYALHPDNTTENADQPASGASDSASVDLACYQEMRTEVMSFSDFDDELEDFTGDEVEEISGPSWDSSLGFGGQVPDLVNGSEEGIMPDEDEAWMGYVRAQLNTLFPDYFDPNEETQEEGGDVSVSTISSNDLITPPGRLGMGRGVPNVRSEIGGLSEEIARLRGVVSGLAEGMRAQIGPEVGESSSAVENRGPPANLTDDLIGEGRPKEFLKVSRV